MSLDLDALEKAPAASSPRPWRYVAKWDSLLDSNGELILRSDGSCDLKELDAMEHIVACVNAAPALIARIRGLCVAVDAAELRELTVLAELNDAEVRIRELEAALAEVVR